MNTTVSILAYSALFLALVLMVVSFFRLARPHHPKQLVKQQARKVA
jgi:hypothetical protein